MTTDWFCTRTGGHSRGGTRIVLARTWSASRGQRDSKCTQHSLTELEAQTYKYNDARNPRPRPEHSNRVLVEERLFGSADSVHRRPSPSPSRSLCSCWSLFADGLFRTQICRLRGLRSAGTRPGWARTGLGSHGSRPEVTVRRCCYDQRQALRLHCSAITENGSQLFAVVPLHPGFNSARQGS